MNNSTFTNDIVFGTVTLEQYRISSFIIFKIIIPTISLIGFVGNGLSYFILADNKAKYAFATYLKALTIVDACLLMSAIVPFIMASSEKYVTTDAFLKVDIYIKLWIGRILGPWFMHVAAVLIAVISFERFVAVLFPLKVRSFVLDIHPMPVVMATMLFHAVIMIPYMVMTRVGTSVDPDTNTTRYFIERIYVSEEENNVFSIYFTVVNFVNYVLPLLVVVCATTAIVISMRLKAVKKTTRGKWCMEKDKMTMVLVVMATFFAINNFLTVVMTTVSVLYPEFVLKEPYSFALGADILLVMICINSANDFVIYILSSRQFRQRFLRKFVFCRKMESRDPLPEVPIDCEAGGSTSGTDVDTSSELPENYSRVMSNMAKY